MSELRVYNRIMTRIDKESTFYINTPLGNIKESEWIHRVKDLIKENQEESLFNKLKRYSRNELAWIHEEGKAEQYALELYAMRIWECDDWVDKDLFNQLYMGGKVQLSLF